MNETIINTLRHIFIARIDNSSSQDEYITWCNALDIVEYALAENLECLRQYDYLETKDDREKSA